MKKILLTISTIIISILLVFFLIETAFPAIYAFVDPNQSCIDTEKDVKYEYDTLAKTSQIVSIKDLRSEISQIQADIDRIKSGAESQISGMNAQIEKRLQLIENIKANLNIKE